MGDMDAVHDVPEGHVVEIERTVGERRRAALGQDALLFCTAFTVGALVFGVVAAIGSLSDGDGDFWTIGLSDDLIFTGLVAGDCCGTTAIAKACADTASASIEWESASSTERRASPRELGSDCCAA